MKKGGFTLVELILTMVIVGIISAVAIPKMFDNSVFQARAYYDEALSLLRYAQKLAIAQRTNVFVNIDTGNRTICLTYVADPTCTTNVVRDPAGEGAFKKDAPSGVTLTTTGQFSFSPLGRPSPDAQVSIGIVSAGLTRAILIERETGYVH